jgi:3',5'-cyclic AMP phosphodiesterase CpdA
MRTIAHLSDLHFGTVQSETADALLTDLAKFAPSVVVISGDLTQRARHHEFQAASDFLKRIPYPLVIVPGNHDIPLYNVARRFLSPLTRYQQYITNDINPVFQDEELLILGINTARSSTFKGVRISIAQIENAQKIFQSAGPMQFKILVTHHPFIRPSDRTERIVGRAALALHMLELSGVELLLAGHFHLGFSADIRQQHTAVKRSILVLQAGTAISSRRRGEPNSYNRIKIEGHQLTVEIRALNGSGFEEKTLTTYLKQNDEWQTGS